MMAMANAKEWQPIMDIGELFSLSIKHNASDLHLAVGTVPFIRVNGQLQSLPGPYITATMLAECYASLTDSAAGDDVFALRKEVDWSGAYAEQRFRGHLYFQQQQPALAIRLLPAQPPSLSTLRAPVIIEQWLQQPSGLILVTGATGAGKSTTLAAMVHALNQQRHCHILTLEDPVEYRHEPQCSLISQRQLGSDVTDFATGLYASLRADPDVIMVGELRDQRTIQLALQAAETGHLLLTTLHTASAGGALRRLIESVAAHQQHGVSEQLASCLIGVIHQQLVNTPEQGRVAAYEVLVATAAVRNLIREQKLAQLTTVMQTQHTVGMQTMAQALAAIRSAE